MKLLNNHKTELCSLSDFEYYHGKTLYEASPDFCGVSSRKPVKKFPDKVKFHTTIQLKITDQYTILLDSGHQINIQITDICNDKVKAEVIID